MITISAPMYMIMFLSRAATCAATQQLTKINKVNLIHANMPHPKPSSGMDVKDTSKLFTAPSEPMNSKTTETNCVFVGIFLSTIRSTINPIHVYWKSKIMAMDASKYSREL